MLKTEPVVAGADALAAVKTYLRIEHGDEDAGLVPLVASAIATCEAYMGVLLIERECVETIDARNDWIALRARPVVAITAASVAGAALPSDDYAIDIDSEGRGRVRLAVPARRVSVTYTAGVATEWADIVEPVRAGIVRLVAHTYAARDGGGEDATPAAVFQLWRPRRRLRLI